MWEVEVTDEFVEWWHGLRTDQQVALTDRIDLLAERGPDLGRPVVDRIQRSRHHNMKELRASEGGALWVLFAFDPRRQVILLLGGDKTGAWNAGTPGRSRPLMTSMTPISMNSARTG